ncbi:chemotaxis protein CheX [Ideonella sp. DXS22W]|uniref:Chemotaxis protein CheX n=1 Tax=Pseudaquabacterium inlustre TaxID=2984192 RepID=A0ABU9CJ36_9BURK
MSDNTPSLAAKVLLLEHDPSHYRALLEFCDGMGLMPLPCTPAEAQSTLAMHKDLAGVLLAEDLPCESGDALALARSIHALRAELPIFLRRTGSAPLSDADAQAVRYPWPTGELAMLRQLVQGSLFRLHYPHELVQGVLDLTREALAGMFPGAEVSHEPPYAVHDRIIFGQVSTLIPIESTWCRGYMMLQTEEAALRQAVIQGLGMEGASTDLSFRAMNQLLAETTNLVWGAFKNRYIPPEAFASEQIQVPIVINHEQKYISFGSSDPQLCVRWRLSDPRRAGMPALTIVQRLIFNLLWSPEGYASYAASAVPPQASGALEFF